MKPFTILLRELKYRRGNFALTVLAVAVAVGALISARLVLSASDHESKVILQRKQAALKKKLAYLQNGMRLATLKLRFNLVILPKDQSVREWYTKGGGSHTMPESYVSRLADAGLVTVRNFLPSLQEEVVWPETKRRIILVGTRSETPGRHEGSDEAESGEHHGAVGAAGEEQGRGEGSDEAESGEHHSAVGAASEEQGRGEGEEQGRHEGEGEGEELMQPVPGGSIVLGYELAHSLKLKPGDKISLMGRSFKVFRCHPERGSRDDITAWIPLKDAQQLFHKPGQINAILALECICMGGTNIATVRKDVAGVLPGTQVLEQGGKVLARQESRLRLSQEAKRALTDEANARAALQGRRERTAALVVPLILVACGIWIAVLTLLNVRERVREIAMLRSFGLRSLRVLFLILARALLAALPGALVGILLGLGAGNVLARWLLRAEAQVHGCLSAPPSYYWASVLLACLLTAVAAWLPALTAIRRDPAEVLKES